jgi:hypothetical protein
MRQRDRTYQTPLTVAELRLLSPNDPAVVALEQPLPDAGYLPAPPGAPALWAEDSGDLSDILMPAYSPEEANARLRAAAAASAATDPVLARLAAVEAELAELRRSSLRGRLQSLLRRIRG